MRWLTPYRAIAKSEWNNREKNSPPVLLLLYNYLSTISASQPKQKQNSPNYGPVFQKLLRSFVNTFRREK